MRMYILLSKDDKIELLISAPDGSALWLDRDSIVKRITLQENGQT